MSQNTTPCAARPELEPRQARALEQLLAGASVTEAAKVARVDRSTVHRWLREDWAFQAAYNASRRDLQREIEARLLHIARAAAEAVEQAVKEGDVRTALAVLKGTGILAGERPVIGPEDPTEAEEEAELVAGERDSLRVQRRLLAF